MKTIFFLLVLFFITTGATVQSEDRWILIEMNKTDNTEWYYDANSFIKNGNITTVWIKTIYKSDSYFKGELIDYDIEKIHFHCGSDKYIIEDLIRHYKSSSSPYILYDVNKEIQTFPDAFSEFLYNYMCNNKLNH